jgi:hypothetical protein
VDRTRAKDNIAAGLVAASIAIGVFGLTFLVAIIYIG